MHSGKCMVDWWCPHWINKTYSQGLLKWKLSWILIVLIQPTFMQPSMGTLNSPSLRVVKDSTPSRHQILRCINFGIGESSPNLVLNRLNLYLVKFEARWILKERALKCLIYFVYLKVNLDPEKKKISLVNLHPTLFSLRWILTHNLDPIVTEKKKWTSWWWILT